MQMMGVMKRHPYKVQLGLATANGGLADLVVQKYGERKESIDWGRNLAFTMFGFAWFGNASWLIYFKLYNRLFPGLAKLGTLSLSQKLKDRAGMKQLLGAIMLDLAVVGPVVFYPVFYTFKQAVQAGEGVSISGIKKAVQNVKDNFVEDNRNFVAFWIPADCVIFAVPLWLRMPANHIAAFCFTGLISVFRGAEEASTKDAANKQL